MDSNRNTKFEQAVAEARHSELIGVLKEVTASLQRPPDTSVQDSLASQLKVLEGLVKVVLNQPKPESPVVNISQNNEELLTAVSHIADRINQQIALMKVEPEKPKEWEFTVLRDRSGLINSIKAKSK
jgi:hypothetical protein